MAQNVIGLDLGSSAVKAVAVKMGLRGSEIIGFHQEPVSLDAEGNSSPVAVMEAAGRLIDRLKAGSETIHCAVNGDLASMKTVNLPTSAARRMEQILKFELDELLPYDIEDAVFDFVELERTGEEIKILSSVVPLDRVKSLIDNLIEKGVDPREVGVAPLAYAVDFEAAGDSGITAVVDMGHSRTNVAVVGDRVPTVRTILRGGRDLTVKLADAGKVDYAQAEVHKVREGLRGNVGEVLTKAVKPLIREIKQTLNGHLAAGGKRVEKILLCGGSAALHGLDRMLANEIGVPVERYGAPLSGVIRGLDSGVHPEAAVLAHALARREEIAKQKRFNVRRGELSFKGDYEYLKSRVAWVGVFALLLLGAWIFSNYAEYSLLESRVESQRERIREETTRLFGNSETDQETIEELLSAKAGVSADAMPATDAFDIVVELSKRIPPSVVHDVELLDIKPKRITLKAIVDSELQKPESGIGKVDPDADGTELSPTDLIQKKLTEFDACFTNIRIGKVQTVGERRKYQMDIESKCP